jgi:hypothetical protein
MSDDPRKKGKQDRSPHQHERRLRQAPQHKVWKRAISISKGMVIIFFLILL